MAQTPTEAGAPNMPEAALATGRVSLMGRVATLGERLGGVARAILAPVPPLEKSLVRDVEAATRQWGKLGVRRFDRGLIARALQTRTALRNSPNVNAYVQLLSEDASETAAFHRELLSPITSFSGAAPGRSEMLTSLVDAYARWRGSGPFRVWSVGCASGQEAYLMAFELEKARRAQGLPPYRVYGTDLLADQISLARAACYSHQEVEGLDQEDLAKFMAPRLRYLMVDTVLRRDVLFTVHDALRDPPVTRTQFIACNAVVQRLQASSQVQLRERLLTALSPGGALFIDGQVHV